MRPHRQQPGDHDTGRAHWAIVNSTPLAPCSDRATLGAAEEETPSTDSAASAATMVGVDESARSSEVEEAAPTMVEVDESARSSEAAAATTAAAVGVAPPTATPGMTSPWTAES